MSILDRVHKGTFRKSAISQVLLKPTKKYKQRPVMRLIPFCQRSLGVCAMLFATLPAFSITLTNDTFINLNDTSYDGSDLVISNCTVTIERSLQLNSLQVLQGGT